MPALSATAARHARKPRNRSHTGSAAAGFSFRSLYPRGGIGAGWPWQIGGRGMDFALTYAPAGRDAAVLKAIGALKRSAASQARAG